MFLSLFGVLTLVLLARANANTPNPQHTPQDEQPDTNHPYSPIWVRNVFDLKPNIIVQSNNVAVSTAPSNIKLIGIYTFGGKRAILSMHEPGNDPGPRGPQQQKKEEVTYTMSEGERRGSLELLEINVKDRFVKIKNEDSTDILHFDTNRPSGPSPVVGGPHPPPAMPGFQPMPQPGMNNYNNGMPAPLPNRTMRSSMQNTPQANYGAAGYSTGYPQTTGSALNLGALFNQTPNSQSSSQSATSSLTPEEQAVRNAIYNQLPEVQSGKAPPLPMLPAMMPQPPNPPTEGPPSGPPTRQIPPLPSWGGPRTTGR